MGEAPENGLPPLNRKPGADMANELAAARELLHRCFPMGGRMLCAVSGGLDSMCLLHFLDTWGRANGFFAAAAHFNHHLRGERADRDQRFVEDWCASRRIPCFTGEGDTRTLAEAEGLSLEEAARKLRYGFLQETARREEFDAVLTAHHADDNAETVLLNLVRGTGLRGLAGIPRQRDGILRPFLEIPREDLAAYAAAHALPHVEDETNADPDAAARNLVRLQVMPLLRRLNSRAAEHVAQAAARLAEMDTGLSDLTERYLRRAGVQPGRVTISLAALAEVPAFLRPRVLLGLFDLLGAGRKDIGAAHLEALERLCALPEEQYVQRCPHQPAPRRHSPHCGLPADAGDFGDTCFPGGAGEKLSPLLGGLHPDPAGLPEGNRPGLAVRAGVGACECSPL